MKNRLYPKVIIAVCMILFATSGCVVPAIFPPTVTPTPTSTSTPTLTPTVTFTPSPTSTLTPTATLTPTPAPEFILAALQVSDFPSNAIEVPIPIHSGGNDKWFSYAFQGEIFFGFTAPLDSDRAIVNFDLVIGNAQLFSSFLALQFPKATIKNVKRYPGLDHFPDQSNAFTALFVAEKDTFKADIFVIRKGSVGSMVLGLYRDSATPSMSIEDLASMVSNKVSQAVK